jgi:Kef-type K+ transport system membrane component KefB
MSTAIQQPNDFGTTLFAVTFGAVLGALVRRWLLSELTRRFPKLRPGQREFYVTLGFIFGLVVYLVCST